MDILGNTLLVLIGFIFTFFSQKKLNDYKKQAILEQDIYLELIKLLNDYKNETKKIYELSNRYCSQQDINKQDEEYLKRLLNENKVPPHIFEIAILQEIISKENKRYGDMYECSKDLFKTIRHSKDEPALYSNKTIENCYIKHQKSVDLLLNEIQESIKKK